MQPSDKDFRDLLSVCHTGEVAHTVLDPQDQEYLKRLLAAIHAGKRAVVIVEEGEKLKFMFSNSSRAEAVTMLGKVIEATGRRMAE